MIKWEKLYYRLLEVKNSNQGEKHHVVPKHDGGLDKDGLVLLERRYHTLAHYIRYKWKGQNGDKVAYKMMLGQVLNPMHDQGMLKKHREFMQSRERRELARKQALEKWNKPEIRSKFLKNRQIYIDNLESTEKLTQHLNTPEGKVKARIKQREYYKNKGGSYIIEKNGITEYFDLKMELVRKMKIDPTTIDKYVNTGRELRKGSLKGYRIFNNVEN
jgi:hypothetical protein